MDSTGGNVLVSKEEWAQEQIDFDAGEGVPQEDGTSNGHAAVLGLQHLLTMYSGDVMVPLLIGAIVHFSATQMALLISMDLFMCGVATLLQVHRTRMVGIGLPVVLGCAVQVITPLGTIGKTLGITTMYGAIIVSGLFVFLMSGVFSKMRKLFPPVVTGSLIIVIGFTLMPVAITDLGGGTVGAHDFGSFNNLLVGGFTLAVIIAMNVWGRGFIKSIAVLIGLVAGTALAGALGMIQMSSVSQSSWFRFPQPFMFGVPHFEWSSSLTMILIALTTMIESTGVFFALGDMTNRHLSGDDLKRGYRAEGIAQMLGGIFNTFPYSTFSENVGIVQFSGVKTRKPIYFAGLFLLILGLLPKVGALATVVPTPVLGGAMLVMFGTVGLQGVRILKSVNFDDSRNLIVAAVSIGAGLGVSSVPSIFQAMPSELNLILGNGVVVTSIVAVVLNLLFKLQPKRKVEAK